MKKKLTLFFIVPVCIVFLDIACTKNSEDKLSAGASACDTTSVKYSTDIVPILQASCYSCHSTSSNAGSGGIIFDSYTTIAAWAKSGYLRGNVTHAPGYVAMPYGSAKLPDCQVNKIVAWINQGIKNN